MVRLMEKLMQCSDQCYGQMESRPLAAGTSGIEGDRHIRRHPPFRKGAKSKRQNRSVMRKNANRFSEKIMFKQRDEIMIRFGFIES
jgi:hypothetical protein